MFDIGFSELLLTAVVALVVLGPERLPKAARFVGVWIRRARAQWESVKQELERELEAEALKRNLQNVQQTLNETEAQLHRNHQHLPVQDSILRGQTTLNAHIDQDTNTGEPVISPHNVPAIPPATTKHPSP